MSRHKAHFLCYHPMFGSFQRCHLNETRSSCKIFSAIIVVVSLTSHIICLCFISQEFLRVRSHDPEEAIRHDVIVSIVTAAKKDLSLVNDALLNFVKERTLDKRVSWKSLELEVEHI